MFFAFSQEHSLGENDFLENKVQAKSSEPSVEEKSFSLAREGKSIILTKNIRNHFFYFSLCNLDKFTFFPTYYPLNNIIANNYLPDITVEKFFNSFTLHFEKSVFSSSDAFAKIVNLTSTLLSQNSFSPTLRYGENINYYEPSGLEYINSLTSIEYYLSHYLATANFTFSPEQSFCFTFFNHPSHQQNITFFKCNLDTKFELFKNKVISFSTYSQKYIHLIQIIPFSFIFYTKFFFLQPFYFKPLKI